MKTLYTNARILMEDGSFLENGQIVIEHSHKEFVAPKEGEKPVKVKPALADKCVFVGTGYTEACEETVDLMGCTVLPGLVDVDTRLDTLAPAADDWYDNIGTAFRTYVALRYAAEALNTGVTTVKAVGMPNNIDIAMKTALSKGMFFGPKVLATGPILGVHGGKGSDKYGMIECSGTDEFRKQARIHISRGLDGITFQVSGDKLKTLNGEFRPEMCAEEVSAMVKHCSGAEKLVGVNASGVPSVQMCLDAGVHAIQQGYRISDAQLCEMAAKGIWYVPCLVSTLGTELEAEHKATVKKAIAAGVKIAVGTDILPSEPVDGTTAVIKEMELLVECGMTPAQAIAAATCEAAKCAKAKAGVLKTGGPCDFVVVDGKPEEDITAMRKLVAVVCNGRRAFNLVGGAKERQFHPHAPLYEVSGGVSHDWTKGALQGVKEPYNFNTEWNLVKEI